MTERNSRLDTSDTILVAAAELLAEPRYLCIESLDDSWRVQSSGLVPDQALQTETVQGTRHSERWRVSWCPASEDPVDRERLQTAFARLIDVHAHPAFSLQRRQPAAEPAVSYQGTPLSPGVVNAVPMTIEARELENVLASARLQRDVTEPEVAAAAGRVTADIRALAARSTNQNAAQVLEAQAMLLESSSFIGAILAGVRDRKPFSLAVSTTVTRLSERMRAVGSSLVMEKVQDIEDLALRLSLAVSGDQADAMQVAGHIVCVDQPQPSTLFQLTNAGAVGIALFDATATSHLAIIASSLPVPTVLFEGHTPDHFSAGQYTLDAVSGAFHAGSQTTVGVVSLPPGLELAGSLSFADTSIADRPTLYANVSAPQDAAIAAEACDGIGLYRTELAWELAGRIPSEEEQVASYRAVFAPFGSRPITVRTADIGGDKPIDASSTDPEDNPFLGVRGIRFSLAQRDLFRRQLRAIVRAGVDRDLRIMLPMVTTPTEIQTAREELAIASMELEQEGVAYHRSPRLGIMVETPAAAIYAEELARQVDFFSIGTNDLVMYLMAVDRTNQAVSSLYRTFHPVVLRTLNTVVQAAHGASIHVSVCGQAAAGPRFLPFLVGIGVDAVSVASGSLRRTRAIIERLSPALCRGFAARLLSGESLAGVLAEVGE